MRLTTCKDLSKVEPTINGPFTPDLATPLSKFASFVKENGWNDELSAGLIGSCTNSSYEDMVDSSRLVHPNATDTLTDTCREFGSAGEGRRAEDAGLKIACIAVVKQFSLAPRSPSSVHQGLNRLGQRSNETTLLSCSRKLELRYWPTHVAHVLDRSVEDTRSTLIFAKLLPVEA